MHSPIYAAILLLSAHSALATDYCHFFSGKACTGTKSVGFSVTDDGCFRAAGKSVKCAGYVAAKNYKLVQSPNNSDNCDCQNACINNPGLNGECTDLETAGLNPDYDTYRFVDDSKCGANNC